MFTLVLIIPFSAIFTQVKTLMNAIRNDPSIVKSENLDFLIPIPGDDQSLNTESFKKKTIDDDLDFLIPIPGDDQTYNKKCEPLKKQNFNKKVGKKFEWERKAKTFFENKEIPSDFLNFAQRPIRTTYARNDLVNGFYIKKPKEMSVDQSLKENPMGIELIGSPTLNSFVAEAIAPPSKESKPNIRLADPNILTEPKIKVVDLYTGNSIEPRVENLVDDPKETGLNEVRIVEQNIIEEPIYPVINSLSIPPLNATEELKPKVMTLVNPNAIEDSIKKSSAGIPSSLNSIEPKGQFYGGGLKASEPKVKASQGAYKEINDMNANIGPPFSRIMDIIKNSMHLDNMNFKSTKHDNLAYSRTLDDLYNKLLNMDKKNNRDLKNEEDKCLDELYDNNYGGLHGRIKAAMQRPILSYTRRLHPGHRSSYVAHIGPLTLHHHSRCNKDLEK